MLQSLVLNNSVSLQVTSLKTKRVNKFAIAYFQTVKKVLEGYPNRDNEVFNSPGNWVKPIIELQLCEDKMALL